jgi:hypothetical protein
MMGRQTGDQSQLFYLFNLEELIPASHLLRRINPVVTRVLAELRENLTPFYSDIGRPSIDPELMLRMLIVATATVSALREGSVRRLSYTSLIGGSVGSISTTKYLTTRRSQSIAMAASATAPSFGSSSRRWSGRA